MKFNNWLIENKKDFDLKFIALLINPILAFFIAIRNLQTKSSFCVLFILSIIFGSSLTVSNIRTENNNFDGIEYRINFEKYAKVTNSDFKDRIVNYCDFTGDTDFFDDSIFFIVSRFTDNYHIMYMILSIVFSLFLLKSLCFFVHEKKYKRTLTVFILLYLFITNQIININAFRFYIALWVSVNGLLNLFINKNKIYILQILFTPFIHASFFLLYILILIYLLCGKITIIRCLFIISLIMSGISVEFLQYSADILPDTIGLKVLSYTNENYMNEVNEGGSGFIWIKRMFETISVLYINLLVSVMLFYYRKYIKHTKVQSLFVFLILLMSFVNSTLFIPSVGSRFIMMALPLIAYIWLVCFSEKKFDKYIYGLGVLFVFHAVLPFNIYQFPCLRFYSQLLEPSFWINSPLISFVNYIFWQ